MAGIVPHRARQRPRFLHTGGAGALRCVRSRRMGYLQALATAVALVFGVLLVLAGVAFIVGVAGVVLYLLAGLFAAIGDT